jgi:mannosyltransferase
MSATVLERPPAAPVTAPARDARWPAMAVVAAPAALALVLTVVGLTARSLGFDEAASVMIASQHGHALTRAIAHDGGNMSGYYVLLHVVIGLFGRGLVAVRLPSAICAVATVALVALLGLRLFDRRTAMFAGLLAAVSLPLVFWGQSARGYAPMVALVTASWLSFVSIGEGRRGAAVAYVITTVLAIYMSFVAVLAVAAQAALVLFARRSARVGAASRPSAASPVVPLGPRSERTFVLFVATCVLGCVPLVVLALARGSGQLFWVPRPSLTSTWQVLQTLASAGLPPSFRTPSAVTIALTLLTGATICLARRPGTRLLLAWLLVPLGLALVESLVGQSIFLPRNLLVALPAVALLLATALAVDRVPRPASWALVLVLIGVRAVPLAGSYGVSPENWKAATAYVTRHARASDCVAFYPADSRMPFAYYGRGGRPVLPADPWGPLHAYVEDYAAAQITGCPRLWLVSSHEGQPNGPAGARGNYARFVTLRTRLDRAYPRHRTTRFGYAATITVEFLSRP